MVMQSANYVAPKLAEQCWTLELGYPAGEQASSLAEFTNVDFKTYCGRLQEA